ncbi:hypothetical protein GCM10025857_34540 [Alicyclobacillus contaminans]|nr:hypothetical protein GCM10025857_34540 [Alicyclobacillus contaminans]
MGFTAGAGALGNHSQRFLGGPLFLRAFGIGRSGARGMVENAGFGKA